MHDTTEVSYERKTGVSHKAEVSWPCKPVHLWLTSLVHRWVSSVIQEWNHILMYMSSKGYFSGSPLWQWWNFRLQPPSWMMSSKMAAGSESPSYTAMRTPKSTLSPCMMSFPFPPFWMKSPSLFCFSFSFPFFLKLIVAYRLCVIYVREDSDFNV